MKISKYLKYIVSVALAIVLLVSLPVLANSQSHLEGAKYEDGPLVDFDFDNNDFWAVTNNKWHRFYYAKDFNFNDISMLAKEAADKHEASIDLYIIVSDEYANYSACSGDTIENKRNAFIVEKIFPAVKTGMFIDDGTIFSGDYFKRNITVNIGNHGRLNASDSANGYELFRMTLNFDYRLTENQLKQVENYIKEWNFYYIENNPVISSATGDEREYLIVKTIFNFICKNTIYDYNVYNDKEHTQYPVDNDRYKFSHSIYGALFGFLLEAYDDDFQYKYVDSDGKLKYLVSLEYFVDSQGLYRVAKPNQGICVCDGFSELFFCLCRYNGIDAKIVEGDYTAESGRGNDPHAWNMVYLKDYLDKSYEWYNVDCTFASQGTQRLTPIYTIVDYDYFLRGSSNIAFSASMHQQLYSQYVNASISPEDYRFRLKISPEDDVYSFVSRRRTSNPEEKFVADGIYNLENYLLIDKDGNAYSLDGENYDEIHPSNGFTYYATGYYYTCELNDYANGIEYTCDMRRLLNVGTYYFDVYTTDGNLAYQKAINIKPLDMGRLDKNYDLSSTTINDSTISSIEVSDSEIKAITEFRGSSIMVTAEVVDSSGTKLDYGTDFVTYCYKADDPEKKHINPKFPGDYIIRFDYFGNYSGSIDVPFEVTKADLSRYKQNIKCRFGADIEKGITGVILGNLETGDNVTVKKNVDFRVVSVTGGKNYLDKGEIVVEAINDSKYFKENTKSIWTYEIDQQYDISYLFDKRSIGTLRYKYTGNPITPTDFKLSYSSSDKKVELVKDVDYKIEGYKNNVNVGTASVIVKFIGNYTGTAEMTFTIEPGMWSVTIPDLTYNKKNQTPTPKVVCGGVTLVKGKDYTVTSKTSTAPGIYTCSIKGIGNYSAFAGDYCYIIKPSKVDGVKVTATYNVINLSWTAQGKNCSYQVYQYDTGKKTWKLVLQSNSTKTAISVVYVNGAKKAVSPNTQYKFKVRAVLSGTIDGSKFTKYGDFAEVTIQTLPKTPAITKVIKTSNSLKVSWNKDSAVSGYNIVLATDSKFTKGVKKATISKNSKVSYTFKNLKKGKTYYLRLRSYKKVGSKTYYSAYSKTVKVKL